MTNTKKYKYWLAVVDGQLVRFSDLPHMMASALNPEGGMDYGVARINLTEELTQAVRDGKLTVRNPAGLGVHTFPHGNALQQAVLMPDIDLEPFLNARGIELRITPHGNGPEYWTIENAANAMQEQLNWHDGTRAEFQDQMQDAAQCGALLTFDPRTCLPPIRTERVRTYWEYVTPSSVNAWLESLKAPYRWSPPPPLVTVPRKSPRDIEPWKLLTPFFEPIEGLYMYQQAGRQIADAEGWDDSKLEALWEEMAVATNSGALPIRNRKTGAVIPPNAPDALALVTVDDVNAWLASTGRPYRWKPKSIQSQPHNAAHMQVEFGAPPNLTSIDAAGNLVFDTEGYERYLKAKSARNAQGRYTVAEAAQVLAQAHGLEPAAFIENRMLPAISAGLLRVIDPADGGPLRGRKCNAYGDEVTPEGINDWLTADGFAKHVRWPEPMAPTAAHEATEPHGQPMPLPTNTIAQLFDGIHFAQERWVKNIGQAKWLASANRGKGEQGGVPATWCPLTIAQLVYAREKGTRAKQKTLASLNNRFRNNPVLKPWKDSWDDYYGMFSEHDEA